MPSIKYDLRQRGLDLVETHISWVFLGEHDVWKVKKPVALGFLDFSSIDSRRDACEAEVRLNRRLAPDVYLGVVPVTQGSDGRHRIGGTGTPVDWAVHMKRLPDDDRADVRLRQDRLAPQHVERLAERIADFHETARCDDETARYGTVDAIGLNIRENFEQTRESITGHVTPAQADEIETWQRTFLQAHRTAFDARIRSRRVRDGHGDLRLDQVYLDDRGRATILDCIEFNERFRYADVCADVAFLSMDLAWHGRVDLAERLLAAYARNANDYDLYPLVDFYESYRAFVRGKVSSILADDETADRASRQRAAQEARRYYLLALASERRQLLPRSVVAVGGIIAAGKSTVAAQIAAEMTSAVIDADRTRKFLLGARPTERVLEAPWQGAYAPETTERVYAELFRRAGAVLASGRPVVLDASFRSRAHREAARQLAATHNVPFFFIECRVDAETARERLRRRAGKTGVSDGRLEIFDDFVAGFEPVEEPPNHHLILDTSRPLHQNIAALRKQVPTWPLGMTE